MSSARGASTGGRPGRTLRARPTRGAGASSWEVGGHRRRDVDHAGIRDRGREPVLVRQRAWDPVAALAHAHDREACRVHVVPRDEHVDHGGHDRLQVGPEEEPLPNERGTLARPVEQKDVPAAGEPVEGASSPRVHHRPVAAVVEDERAAPPRAGAQELAGERGPVVGDRDALHVEAGERQGQLPAATVVLPQREEGVRALRCVRLVRGRRSIWPRAGRPPRRCGRGPRPSGRSPRPRGDGPSRPIAAPIRPRRRRAARRASRRPRRRRRTGRTRTRVRSGPGSRTCRP